MLRNTPESRLRIFCFRVVSLFLFCVLACTSIAQAETIELINADFELGSPAPPNVAPGGTSHVGNIPGWNVVNSGGVFAPDFLSELSYPADVESTTGSFTAYSQNNASGLVSQFIGGGRVLQADRVYIISVDIGHRLDEPFSGGFGIMRITNPFPTSIISVAANDPGPGNFARQTLVIDGSDIPAGDLGNSFRIGLFGNQNIAVDFDNVTLEIVFPGDINLDGQVNLLDVSPFIDLLAEGTFQAEADLNQDGAVNLLDVQPFVELLAGE